MHHNYSNNFKFSNDFIKNGYTGITCDTSKPKIAATEIINLLSNQELVYYILSNAKNYYIDNHFDANIMSNHYSSFYKS